ncbi:hypothetical protein SIAM614_12028 [Stappia aggregata IAM 12614]|uniref:Uncharacterized protein n=1 Tax=Roseibium aggregatum (strain ATCC 25650 / DSM 13394 / JCM 20685 / NBRC 16684 / NCIMB 2208 / IAM 12614 / B1) TaxID=384765 RepID=A0NTU3_ROSAI|nr:hypothetical protein SIAM614_12028 [Stappia aggregata IAM 12614] [Roseibium aggregatum IAM 12614]
MKNIDHGYDVKTISGHRLEIAYLQKRYAPGISRSLRCLSGRGKSAFMHIATNSFTYPSRCQQNGQQRPVAAADIQNLCI